MIEVRRAERGGDRRNETVYVVEDRRGYRKWKGGEGKARKGWDKTEWRRVETWREGEGLEREGCEGRKI